MSTGLALNILQITNQCVVVCNLANWTGPDSAAWELLAGTQDDIGRRLATLLDQFGVRRIDDFGGVCESFLCNEEEYLKSPPRTKNGAAVFSFTPKKRIVAEGVEMARVSSASGYSLLILTVQKHDKYGKVWVLCGALRHLAGSPLTFYEDTNSIVDDLKSSPEGDRVTAVHVQAPGFESYIAHRADRVVSQAQYQREALE